jgi:PIN domain nuclease of toxin-antitoxin system
MSSIPLLLDTCATIWLAEAQPLAEEARPVLEEAYESGIPVYVSPITAWEIGILVSRRRLSLLINPETWFARLFDVLSFRLSAMSPEVLIASSFLPGSPPRDPADRIMAATARELGYMLVTRDRSLLRYAEQGHIRALAC